MEFTGSLPAGERGLKSKDVRVSDKLIMSLPAGERGLKSREISIDNGVSASRSPQGSVD